MPPRYGTAKTQVKPDVFNINKSFSKRFKFAENFERIRFECAQKPELPLQACLLACVMRRNRTAAQRRPKTAPEWKRTGIRDRRHVLFVASCVLAHHRAGVVAKR